MWEENEVFSQGMDSLNSPIDRLQNYRHLPTNVPPVALQHQFQFYPICIKSELIEPKIRLHHTVRPKGTFAAKIDFNSKNWRIFFFQSLLMKFCFLNPNLLSNCGKAYANPPNLVVIIARSLQLIKPLISHWILGILSWNFDWMVISPWQTKIIN